MIGRQLGDYHVERLIGRGGMSEVYFARHRSGGQGVAIKVLQNDLPDNIEADRRLEQEARAVARIQHINVVQTLGHGRTPEGLPYIVMEYLEGVSLSQRMVPGQVLAPREILPIVQQMLAGLAAAHALEIIHRDIKPDNIFLVEGDDGAPDVVKMLDFGIAKLLGTQPHSLVETVRGVVLGTPEYLPPEIAMDLTVSAATDIYAVGIILFEALTGRLPFSGRGPAELAEHHCFTPPPRPRTFNRDIPRELEQVILRCMAKDPVERYQSAPELAEALTPFAELASGAAQTVVSRTVNADTNDYTLDDIERVLRGQVIQHWIDRTLPALLTRSLTEMDGFRRRIEQVGTELAVVRDQIAQPTRAPESLTETLEEVNGEEERLAEQTFQIHERLRHLSSTLDPDGGSAESLLAELLDVELDTTTDGLQAVLSQTFLDRLGTQLRRETEIVRIESDQRRVLAELKDVAARRARVVAQRAELESEILAAQGEHIANRLQLLARRDALEVDYASARRTLSHALARFAFDLAVAIGR